MRWRVSGGRCGETPRARLTGKNPRSPNAPTPAPAPATAGHTLPIPTSASSMRSTPVCALWTSTTVRPGAVIAGGRSRATRSAAGGVAASPTGRRTGSGCVSGAKRRCVAPVGSRCVEKTARRPRSGVSVHVPDTIRSCYSAKRSAPNCFSIPLVPCRMPTSPSRRLNTTARSAWIADSPLLLSTSRAAVVTLPPACPPSARAIRSAETRTTFWSCTGVKAETRRAWASLCVQGAGDQRQAPSGEREDQMLLPRFHAPLLARSAGRRALICICAVAHAHPRP